MSDNTSYFDLYKALKADGAVQGDWGSFHKFVGAPGKQGYLNRKKLYDALKADGAVQSNTYEEFNMKLFRGGQARLKAAKQRQAANTQTQQQKPSKPQTTAQMAMSQGYKQHTTATPTGTDYMQNWQLMHKRNDQMNPTERMQANTMRSRMQQAQKQATQQEQRRANPISQSRVTPNAQNFNETMQQLATPQAQRARAVQQRVDDATNLAEYEITGNNFVHNDGKQGTISPEIDSLVAPSMKEADDLSWSQYQQDLKKAGNDAYLRNKAWKDLQDNRIKNRQNVLADNLSAKLQEIYSQKGLQEHIIQSADKLNMGVEEYVDKYVTPQMMQRAQNILGVKNIEEVLPQSATEYVTRRLSDSILGTLSAGQDKSREQIAREQEAMAIADGLEEMPTVNGYKANEGYKSGVGARFVSTAANMAMDSPILGMTGSGANLTVDLGKQVLMKGLAKAGLVKAGAKLTTQQLAFKAANMTMAQKIASGLVEGTAKSALNLGGYSSITAALGQASTGDDTSLSALGQAALGGFEHGATTGAMFGVSGAIMAPWVSKFGINGLETSTGEKWLHGAQKFGATAAGLGVEAGTMMVADNITGDKDISVGTWLEDLVMVGAFKAGEPKNYGNIGRALYGLTHNTNNTFRVGKDANGKWRTVDIRMTKEEQNELMNSVSGKNLVEAFQKVDKSSLNSKTPLDKSITKMAYENFMKDPEISQSTKEKVNAAMGLFNTTRGRSYRSVNDVKNKQILEYSKNGTLLTRTSYKNADERRSILYKQKLYRDNEEMRSLAGYSKLKDLQLTDENGEVTKLALGFLVNKGYNVNENAAEANNARLVASLRDKNSDLYKEWEQYVNRHGMLGELISENGTFDSSIMAGIKDMLGLKDARINLDTIMRKDPMKRTDEENKIFYAVKNQLEAELFPNGKPHAEQSETQGRNVAEENNLGSEQPNPQPVMDELSNLRAAEQALEQAMDGNDVFKQVFEQCQKQGIRPVDAYDVLIQNGLTQEEIAPLADYINANARVQGMQTATQQAIEEHVGARVSDWSYKGSLNGGNEIPMGMDASKMLYVNWNGKTYIVGNGDVSFDSTGRAKEDVGDMLVCLDPETNTMEYIPTREVTFGGTESANDYAAKYRQQLQMINSQPYNAAAQEQAMQDAAKPQSKEEAQQTPENGGENAGVESRPQNAPKNNVSSDNQEVNEDREPGAEGSRPQPQQVRKFADGTDVPMTKDSKGRPTPDYGSMKPEQAAEILTQDFGENAEKVVDGQVKKAEKALKDAENMKVDYSAEPNDILEQEQVKAQTIEAAKQQLEQAQNIKKAMTAKKVAETVAKPSENEKVDEANQASPIVREKFDGSKKVAGRRGSITLPGGKKIRGTYYYGETSGLTPSHDPFSDFKQNEGFPVNEDGTTANSRSYKDKGARQFTEQIGNNFNGLALKNVPVVQDGVVLSGNGTTMAKLLAERNGKDEQYREDLNDNIEGFGLTPEKIAEVGDKGIVYFVPDEKFPLSSKAFDMFNKRETKSESNTEQAVAKAKTLTADEVGAIVADIEGNGSLDAFFNNSKAINDLIRTLVDKGIIGQNEVDGFMDGTERLSAQGKEYVKNLLLGSVFKPETIRMLGIDGKIKNAAINGIRAIMDNLKLGDYSLRDELDQAVQLLYEARRSKMSVENLLRQNSAFDENARDRFPMIAQAMAQALEGRTSTFRELMNEYNDIAKNYNTSEGTLDFYDKLTPEQLVDEFLNASKAIKNNNIKLYGKDSETEGGNDAASNEEPAKEAGGAVGTEGNEPAATRNGEWFDQSVEKLKTAKEEERKQILDDMAEYVKGFAKKNGYAEPEVYKTKEELLADAKDPVQRKNIENFLRIGGYYPAYYEDGKVHLYLEGIEDSKELAKSFAHEYVHKDNDEDPSRVSAIVYAVSESGEIKRTDLLDAIYRVCGDQTYRNEAERMAFYGEDPLPMLADEALAHIVQEIYTEGEDVVSQITSNPTLQKIALDAYKFRENERRSNERSSEVRDEKSEWENSNGEDSETNLQPVSEGGVGQSKTNAGRGDESSVRRAREADEDKPNSVGFTPKQIREHQASVDEMREAYIKALQDGKSEKEVEDAAMKYEFAFKDHQNMMGIMDEASVEDLWKKELEAAKASVPVPVMPKPVEPSNPIEKAAEDYKKEHPLTEEELLNTTAFDDLPDDQKQYCIDAALDYLNGEDNSAIAEAYYRNAYEKRAKVESKEEEPKVSVSSDPMEGLKNAADGYDKERKQKEATQKVLNVIKASNEKAKTRKQLEAEKNAADNEFEAFMKDLQKKRRGQLNSGFIDQNLIEAAPKMFSLAAKCAYTRIKLGMYDAKEVVKDLRERFKEAFEGFDKRDIETFYSEIMNQKWRDGDKRMSLNDWAEHYRKLSPEYKEKLEGDSKDAEERKQNEASFIGKMRTRIIFSTPVKSITEMRKIAESCGLKDVKDTDLQELAETAVSSLCREVCESKAMSDEMKFRKIKHIYDNQPSLNQRDSERVMKQQYSTPAPYAFLADMYVKGNGKEVKSALEPSAGNGMLTIGLPMDAVHVNDIDAQRLANLRRQGFKNVTSQDGTQPFADKDVDVVVTNPPFGSATPKEYDGYKIGSLEGQMAINALESMKDDGRAAIIIGGKTEYAKNGSLNPKDKAFLGYLYSHYNVEDVINVDGSLYAKQGTTYPTRIILINGRRKFDPENKVFPPVEKDARAKTVKDYDELYKRIEDDILRSKEQPVDIRRKEKQEGDKPSGRENVSDSTEENGGRGRLGTATVPDGTSGNPEPSELDVQSRPVEQSEDANGRPVEAAGNGDSNTDGRGGQTPLSQSGPADGGSGRGGNVPSGGNEPVRNGNGENGRERGVRHGTGHIQQPLDTTPKEEKKQTLTTEKVQYQPHSSAYSIGAVVPARQKEALDNVLNKLGDADQYLVDNLGYNDKEDLYAHLAAEQIDAVALGLKQMEKGNGFIIGDQTGIGKGRQAAAIIRYAVKQGRIPISFTQKANLFSDTYRDLNDIGSPELRPFILASDSQGNIKVNYDEEVKGLDGKTTTVRKQKIVYKIPSKAETERVLKYITENGKLPEGYDYILTTYSQIRNGMEEWKGGKWKAKKKVTATDRNGQMKRDAIRRIAENSIFILDESHDAAGEGSGSAFIQEVLPKVKGVTFLSATYAKTPDAMKLYALKTDLGSKNKEEGEKGDASWKVLNAIKKGGAVFQEIMSQALTKSGQMIRRERDMTGVTIDWNPLTEDEVEIQAQRDKFDNIFGIFNDILNFQRTYVDAKLGQMSDDLAFIQGSADHTPGTKDMGIGNVTFASKAYNVVQQALFSIKAEKVADYAIESLKNGEKPVIAVNNTMGTMIKEYPMGVEMDMPDLNSTLMKGLEGILRYTEKNDMGDQVNSTLRVEELGEEAVARYNEIKQKIASVSSGLSISPIDVIKHRLEEAGYKVGELTGRDTEMVYNENGKVVQKSRTDKNKNALADRFNNGDLDVLIINRSAAAGISLHASSKFKDQRQRTMIFAQMQGNINDEVQIRGRIDRTGQVRRGKYVYLVSAIPAEQRLMMMFKNKLKSLDANTTSSQKSKFNEVDVQDFTNKYGDEIVLQYMAQHPEYYNKLADPLGWGFMEYARDGLSISELKSDMKPNITSPAYEVMKRLTLLPVKEQEIVLKDISDSYSQKIKQLDDMGMNDLEMTDMPLEAKTLKREVWKEGSDPGGDNAFADNTYIETVEMNVLRKPMKAEEVKDAQKKMLDGKDYETWRNDKVAEIRAAQQAKIEDTKVKMAEQTEKKVAKVEESTRLALEKENAKIQKKLDKGEELKPGEHVLTEEEIKTRVNVAVDDVKRRLSEKLSDAIKNVNAKYDMFVNPLFIFDPNKTISVSNDWYLEELSTSLYPEFGRVIGFKYDKNYNLGSSSIIIATTDSRKRVEIPLNRQKVFERIQADSERFGKECKVVNMDAWDRMIPKKDRTTGRIITGNMLEALADNSSIGHLISYTTDDGKVKQGILVPDSVSTEEITGNMPIAKAYNWLTKKNSGAELTSTDGGLKLVKNWGDMYTLYVPASRKEGGKYYLNQDLLDLVHGHNFQSKGKNFWATFDSKNLQDVLYHLNKMGVEVKTPNDFEESRAHYRTADGEQGNDAQSIVDNHIANVSEKVGGKVNMVNSVDEITNPKVKADIEAGKNVTGWYDEKTGEVHLYMPNIHDRYTAEKTIWHEVVGHKGMRELLGEDGFRKFIREVWDNLDKPEYASLKKLVDEERRYNPFDIEDAIEEGIARLAEEGRGDAGLWNSIKNKVSDFLHEIGYRLAPNTKDVKYLLWLSKNLQKNPNDPYYKMRAEAVKYRLDHEDIPAVTEHDGMFHDNDGRIYKGLGDLPKAEYQEATDGQIHFRTTPSAGTALDRYHRSLDAHGYMFTESYMDNMLSLKNLITAIVPGVKIEDIASSENPYILQNTMQGAMSDAAQMFERNVMKPLDKAMAQVLDAFEGKKDDEKIRNFNLYMITKHGLERNRILYVRDTLKAMRMDEKQKKLADTIEFDWDNEKARLDEELERGDIDLKEYYSQMDDFIRTYVDSENKFDAGEHDYSGIHAIQEIDKSSDPYDDAAAIASVMDSEGKMEDIKKGSVADYWNKVKAATQYSLDTDYKNGLISRELYGHVSGMFNWYVPLRKYDEAAAEDTYGYITEKGDPKSYIGSTIMRARGHKYLSETNVLAQIGAMGNRAINNGGKNAIKQAFARFIRNHSNNNLVTETSVWYADDPITQTTVERYPDIPEDATPDEISQIVADFNAEMKDLESKGLATKVYRRGKIGYKFQRAENKSQHIVDVMIAGKKHSFIVNGNPRAAQALNGLLEHKNETGIGKIAGKISRFMAQTCTSYNPEFVMRNMMRDFEFASSNLLAKEGARYTGVFEKYYAKVGIIEGIRNSKLSDFKDTGGFGLFAKYRNGTLDTSDKIQRYFKEFMENGGETGWVQIKDMKEWTEEYKRNIKAERNKASKIGKGFYNVIFKNLENVNEIAENMARFATYCASRDYGRSVVRSTYDAKEVSTNFNRHGSGSEIKSFKNGEMGGFQNFRKNTYRFTSAWFRNTSMFFNAGIQSTNLLVKNLKNNTAGTLGYIASGPMISGMAMALLNNFLIANEDEKDRKGVKDPYGELPDYIRRNNLCVYVGGGEFVTIPLAIEERAFYGLGDLAAGLTFSPNVSGQKNPFLDAVGCMSQLVPVADYLGNASFGKHPVQETVKAVMPSATSPFIEWAYNSDWKGAPIERDNKFDENQPAWMLAYKGTPDFLISLNKKANAYTNDVAKGNEDMKGNDFLDALTNPSGLQHFYSGYLGGAATFAERSLGLIKHGKDAETKDIPFVRSIFYTPSEQSNLQRTKSKWYNYKDEMETTIANVDRLKSKNVPIDKRLANIGDYYEFQNSKDAAKMRVIELAEKQMKQWKKLRDKSGDTESIKFANENIDRIMMEAVEQLDKLN